MEPGKRYRHESQKMIDAAKNTICVLLMEACENWCQVLVYYKTIIKNGSCEFDDFVETHRFCKLRICLYYRYIVFSIFLFFQQFFFSFFPCKRF